jgi:hypothetical protein
LGGERTAGQDARAVASAPEEAVGEEVEEAIIKMIDEAK